jgi:hypothetical protein
MGWVALDGVAAALTMAEIPSNGFCGACCSAHVDRPSVALFACIRK